MLWSIFAIFFKIGLFTIGGGYAMLPALQAELTKHCLLTDEECLDAISLVNGLPGPLVVTGATFMGYRIRGIPGACAAVLGAVLPSIIVILAISSVFAGAIEHAWVRAFFAGARPAVCSLILYSAVRIARRAQISRAFNAALALATFAAVRFLSVPHAIVIAGAAFAGIAAGSFKKETEKEDGRGSAQ